VSFDFRLQNLGDYRPWLLSLAVVALFVTVNYVIVGGPVFETIDDPSFAFLVAGIGMVDKPDYHVYFIHVLVTKFLVFLHGIWPRMPWYSIYLLACQVIAMTVIVRLLGSKFTRGTTAVIVGVMFLFIGCTRWVNYLQYTSTGALVGMASSLLMIAALEHRRHKRTFAACLIGSFALLIFAATIRPWAGYMSCVLTSIALLARFPGEKLAATCHRCCSIVDRHGLYHCRPQKQRVGILLAGLGGVAQDEYGLGAPEGFRQRRRQNVGFKLPTDRLVSR
jgi:hypothetical protein